MTLAQPVLSKLEQTNKQINKQLKAAFRTVPSDNNNDYNMLKSNSHCDKNHDVKSTSHSKQPRKYFKTGPRPDIPEATPSPIYY